MFRNNISSDTLVVKIFVSFCHVHICIRPLGYFRIENMTNRNLNKNQNCKKCCRCNFVTWKLIFLVSWKVMLWCQCLKFLNLFRNRVSLHDVIIFCYVLFFLLFDIESLIQIRMICTHVIVSFIKTPAIVPFVQTPSITSPCIICETCLYRFWSFRSYLRFRFFKTWKISFRWFTLVRVFRILDSFRLFPGYFLVLFYSFLSLLLDHDLLCLSL